MTYQQFAATQDALTPKNTMVDAPKDVPAADPPAVAKPAAAPAEAPATETPAMPAKAPAANNSDTKS